MSRADNTIFERIDCFVEYVASRVLGEEDSAEDKVSLSTKEIATVLRVFEQGVLEAHIQNLEEQGFIVVKEDELCGSFNIKLTRRGWDMYRQKMAGEMAGETYGFLAMRFDNDKIESFAHNMKFKLQKFLGVILLDIRDFPGVGDLVEGESGIKAKIESADFFVADLTSANPNVYWESGYAEGLGKHVIYICWVGDDRDERVHFNVEHKKRLIWGEDRDGDFFFELFRAVKLQKEGKTSDV